MSSDESDTGASLRTRSLSASELMMGLSMSSPRPTTSSPIEGPTVGKSLLDLICVNHSSKPGAITIYEDRLHTNIIGELGLKQFLTDNRGKRPVVRRSYTEVLEIDKVSYRLLCIITKMG